MKRFEPYATTLPPDVVSMLREVSRESQLPAAAIVREILTPEAIASWRRARMSVLKARLTVASEDYVSRRLLSESAGEDE